MGYFYIVMTYADKLKDPRWQKKRLEIFQRDNFTCVKCLDTEDTLHVHHRKYEYDKDPWDIDNCYLITVCEDCHKTCENRKKLKKEAEKFNAFKIKVTNNKAYITYEEGFLYFQFKNQLRGFVLKPVYLKKITHFIINNWLQDGE